MSKTKRDVKIKKEPWPTKAAMEQVYDKKLWGENTTPFYSGDGSHYSEIVDPYIDIVVSFLKSFKNALVVCDLGCGDFNIGRQLLAYTQKYITIDIVPDLIAYNKKEFNKNNLEFQCLDIAVDNLPNGDCAIVRQVLQHLSNHEIQNILNKLSNFKHIILTEHLPLGNFEPNKDIISGQGIRLKKQSGLDVLAAPFNFKVKEAKELSSIVLDDSKGVIVTWLYKVF